MGLLETIDRPADIKSFTPRQLDTLSAEIRQELITTIADLGGHLASSLGAVELCLALHYVFDAPEDQMVWDMGYQAFTHKLITGRRGRFNTLKQLGGLSGFMHKDESPYDLFSSGHGGTVLSTAMGLAMARDQAKAGHHVVSIIGDASLGEGMALEALNHIGHAKPNLLVILNDNRMSIAKPVGGLSRYLTRIITNPTYNKIRDDVEELVQRLPIGSRLLRLGHKVEESVKGFLTPGLLFEELGYRYVGPIDGHNIRELIRTLKGVKRFKGPILLHVSTKKGKGYKHAEQDPERFHKIEKFDPSTGQELNSSKARPVRSRAQAPSSFTGAFSEELIRLAESNPRIIALTAAMPEGTGVGEFSRRFPSRCIDVGMAEQHAVGLAAGYARGGGKPVVAIYSTFLQRAYDQIMHEMCLQELPVVLAIDRSSLVGEDGPTHHGVFDVAYLRVLPNIRVISPKDPQEMKEMLRWALEQNAPVALRYARGGIMEGTATGKCPKIQLGKSETVRQGKDLAIIAIGNMVYTALKTAETLATEGIKATVINARFIKPLDDLMLKKLAQTCGRIVTVEESQIAGGFGSAVSETLDQLGLSTTPHLRVGLADTFIEHGKRHELLRLTRLDSEGLTSRIREWLQRENRSAKAGSVSKAAASE